MSHIINIQQIIQNEISIAEAKKMVIMHKGEAYTFFDEGCTRHVFVNADSSKVIKILRRDCGVNYNTEEAEIYKNANPEDKKQMCETTIHNGVIEQKYCEPIKFGGRKLNDEQKAFAMSCRNEVGWLDAETLVCFDLDEFKKY